MLHHHALEEHVGRRGKVAPELQTVKQNLEDLERALTVVHLGYFNKYTLDDILPFEEDLNEIAAKREDNAFKVDGKILPGQAVLSALLHRCYLLLDHIKSLPTQVEHAEEKQRHAMQVRMQQIMMRRTHSSTGAFGKVDPELTEIKNQLEHVEKRLAHLLVQPRGSFQLESLVPLQEELAVIDGQRTDNAFKIGETIPAGQAVLSQLLNRCYVLLELVKGHAADY